MLNMVLYGKDIDEDNKIKKVLNTKNKSLLDRVSKINITSSDPPVPPKLREHVKKADDYAQQKFEELEYGFCEPPLGKMQKDKLMFREAIEILRARMELVTNKSPPDLSLFEHSSPYIDNHPAVQRVDKDKLERVWKYFRPFALIREQKMLRKEDMEAIDRYIEGSDDSISPYRLELRKRLKQLEASGVTPSRVGNSEAQQAELEKFLMERHEKEKKRLHKRLEELKELEEETQKRKKG
uniref:Uncharacterized protein n=1 Tax=Globodera pallida TaxID=36090 RepID=A0A183CBE7_GLOPA